MKIYNIISIFLLITFAAYQSDAQFGKNKLQYQSFDWKYIESKHFDIYFYDGAQQLAEFTALKAEESLLSIQNTLKFNLTKRVSIIVYNTHNEFQQTNVINQYLSEGIGGATEMFKNRVVIPFQGDYNQFEHVIHHELVHAVVNDMFYGGTFQTSLSVGANIQFPLWMSEGIAEYESIGGMDAANDMYMRDVALGDNMPDLVNMDGYAAYRWGQTFFWYVADKYGKERVGELLNRLRIYKTLDAAFKATFSMTLEEFSNQFKKDLKKYYWPDIVMYKAPEDYSTRITNHEKERSFYNTSPAISPDGSKFAYISDRDGLFAVFVQSLDNYKKESPNKIFKSLRAQVFEDLNLLTPGISWNPEGTKLAVSAKTGGEDALFIVNAENGDYDRIKLGLKSITSVTWSPDGKRLAFIAQSGSQSDIYLYEFKTEKLEKLTDDLFTDQIPLWSPDSKVVYFVSDRGDKLKQQQSFKIWRHDVSQSDIYAIDISTKDIKRITYSPSYLKTSLAISSDGKQLLFVSDDNGIGNIYQLNLENGFLQPKTNSITGITQLSLAKDDSKVLFSSMNGAGFDIFMIKNPFERRLDTDTLPLTNYRLGVIEKKNFINSISAKVDTIISKDEKRSLIGYGKFELEFDRQQLVKPNKDAMTAPITQGVMDKDSFVDTNFIVRDYKIRFSLDYMAGNPGYNNFYGVQGVAQALFSDVLGNHQIYGQAYLQNDLRNSTFQVMYLYLPNQIDLIFSGYHYAFYLQNNDGDYYRYRRYGIDFTAQYPFSLFDRVEFGMDLINASIENISRDSIPWQYGFYLYPNIQYVHDDVLYGWYGPNMGMRYNFTVKGSPKIGNEGAGFMSFTTDIRKYLPISDYMGFAFRVSGGVSLGQNPQTFSLGGIESWLNYKYNGGYFSFDKPSSLIFTDFIMPIRGVEINRSAGSQYFLANAEFRFPLIYAMVAGPLPILFQAIMGNVFVDIGGAWSGKLTDFKATTDNVEKPNLLMTSGFGIRSYILGLPFKFDVAWQNLFSKWTEPRYLYSLGYDF